MSKKDKWNKGVDQKAVAEEIRKAEHYLGRLAEGVRTGSINTDVDYGYVFDSLDRLYTLAQIDRLAEENRKRLEKERKERERNDDR